MIADTIASSAKRTQLDNEVRDTSQDDINALDLLQHLPDPDFAQRVIDTFKAYIADYGRLGETFDPAIETLVNEVLPQLPHEREGVIEVGFWDTPAGQFLAEVFHKLYRDKLITVAEAAALLYGNSETKSITLIRQRFTTGSLRRFRRPASRIWRRPAERRKTEQSRRQWLVHIDDLNRLIEEKKNKF